MKKINFENKLSDIMILYIHTKHYHHMFGCRVKARTNRQDLLGQFCPFTFLGGLKIKKKIRKMPTDNVILLQCPEIMIIWCTVVEF